MIWFVNLNTGNVYDGLNPYIHYFDKQQSTNLIYTKKICVISEKEQMSISIESNDVFHLIDISKLNKTITINDFEYHDVSKLYTDTYTSTGYKYKDLFLHMIYVSASSDNVGEFHQEIVIGDDKITVAADFYMEYEPHKINLANMGVEIPDSIQKAIYEVNVHEENKDNITLNRKWKELLLNYWDTIANKGSYKSLINSLNWFEYGDLVTIKEFWKHREWSMDRFNHKELSSILDPKINSMLSNFSKTTYIGLYLALQGFTKKDGVVIYEPFERNEKVSSVLGDVELKSARLDRDLAYNKNDDSQEDGSINQQLQLRLETYIDRYKDESYVEVLPDAKGSNWKRKQAMKYSGFLSEKNPALYNLSFLWSINDLNLKMYLLGSFYEAYFMPVHLDLLHSTVESIVYSNTYKLINNTKIDRYDYVGLPKDFDCSVCDGDVFRLGNVEVEVGPGTVFGSQWSGEKHYGDMFIFGVDEKVDKLYDDKDLKTFYSQDYNGVGVVVPFECSIPVDDKVFVNRSQITVTRNGVYKTHIFNTLFAEKDGVVTIKFNLLFTDDDDNKITLEFNTNNGETFIKTITIHIVNTEISDIKVYRIKSKTEQMLRGESYDGEASHDYIMTHIRELSDEPNILKQYIPATLDRYSDGVKLNNIVVLDLQKINIVNNKVPDFANVCFPSSMWKVYAKEKNNIYSYLIAVSKYYIYDTDELFDPEIGLKNAIAKYCQNVDYYNEGRYIMIRNDVGFFPENHYLVPIEGNKIEDFTVNKNEALCVIPELNYSRLDVKEYEWVFINKSTRKEVKLRSVKNPFIANEEGRLLEPGYYTIVFRYKLGSNSGIKELAVSSAFLVK